MTGTDGTDTRLGGSGDDIIHGLGSGDAIYGDASTATAALDVTAALADLDGSETLGITVAGIPANGSLSAGTETSPGVWQLSPDELEGLTVSVPSDTPDFPISLNATATEDANGDRAPRTAASDGAVEGGDGAGKTVVRASRGEI